MAKILLVEDDPEIQKRVRDYLSHEKYVVDATDNGDDAIAIIQTYPFDIVVLDWNLKGAMTGIDVLKSIRQMRRSVAVLMLTGRADIHEKELGLDAGADDYLTKPFEPRELGARLRSLLRRATTFSGTVLSAGPLELDTTLRVVKKEGVPIELLPLEYSILELFMRHPEKTFTQDEILDRAWSADGNASKEVLRTYIKTIRKKIDKPNTPSIIATVFGVGYKLSV